MFGNKWFKEEIDLLKEQYSLLRDRNAIHILIKLFPRHTKGSIQDKIKILHLTKKDWKWNKKELEILFKYYPLIDSEIFKEDLLKMLPNRSWSSIQNEAYKNRLFQNNQFWSTLELDTLRDSYSKFNKTMTKEDICLAIPNRAWRIILAKVKELNLTEEYLIKICGHCKIEKVLSNFRINSRAKTNLSSWCKPCEKEYQKINYNSYRLSRHKGYKIRHKSLEVRYRYLQSSAKDRKIVMFLTFDEYKNIAINPCYYCNDMIETGVGLDRINNDKSMGYRVDNVLPCCNRCNRTRGNFWSVEETKLMIQTVLKFRKMGKF